MKFEKLSELSKMAAINALSAVITTDFENRGDLSESRANYLAHAIREAFCSLEGEKPKAQAGQSVSRSEDTKPSQQIE